MTDTTTRFGPYGVTVLLDGIFEAPKEVLAHLDGEAAREKVPAAWPGEKVAFDVNCFLLRGPGGLTLIDAGTSTAWGPSLGKARQALRDLGIEPGAIDRVLLTHLHGDHALGLFEDGKAWLPRAEILVAQTELAFFTDETARASLPESRQGAFKTAARLLDLYRGRLATIGSGPVPGMTDIEAVPLPGHTLGQMGYRLGAGPDALLIWADALHLIDVQTGDPRAALSFDLDADTAGRTRLAMLEQAATEGWLVTGSHVRGLGRIMRKDGAFAFTPV